MHPLYFSAWYTFAHDIYFAENSTANIAVCTYNNKCNSIHNNTVLLKKGRKYF